MKLILNNDEKSSLKMNSNDVETIIQAVNNLVGENLVFSHLIIDDQTIYSDHEIYIERYINKIEVINIIAKTKRDFINETLITAEIYLKNSFHELNGLTEQFYNGPTEESWGAFKNLSEGIQWLTELIIMVDRMKERPSNWQEFVDVYHRLVGVITELADAVENQDAILIADLMNYEIKPLFEDFLHLITKTIGQEGSRPNAN
ncbi:hypothetical protein [Gracilibacillus xinjiangensis]|uniref:Uncharacterized protein n=1 Tax=Gracilibacillus xinjiangensis TaxID=1193282 RepID=A0ABV8WUK4_9BACI